MEEIGNTKLVVHINRDTDVSLSTLGIALVELNSMYASFVKSDKKSQLMLKEVRQGSIIVELLDYSASVTPYTASALTGIAAVNNIVQFCKNIKLLKMIGKKEDEKEIEKYKKENNLKSFQAFLYLNNSLADNIEIKSCNNNNTIDSLQNMSKK